MRSKSDSLFLSFKRKFSFALFFICITEALLWSVPLVSAASQISVSDSQKPELLHDYLLREIENLKTYENHQVQDQSLSKAKDTTITNLDHQKTLDYAPEYVSGADPVSPAWNFLTWSAMTVLTVALGFAERRIGRLGEDSSSSSSGRSNEDDGGEDDDADAHLMMRKMKSKQQVRDEGPALVVSSPDKTIQKPKNIEKPLESPHSPPLSSDEPNFETLTNDDIVQLIRRGDIKPHHLEKLLNDSQRSVAIRRVLLSQDTGMTVDEIPFKEFNFDRVTGKCCENVIGYLPIPIGIAGPLRVNGVDYRVPLATTEGALVASTQRGCKAITSSGGANAIITSRGMTRGPCVRFPNCVRAGEFKAWIDSEDNFKILEHAFNSSSRFAKLQSIKVGIAGRNVYLRFRSKTGDAMGMNMISKGTKKALAILEERFNDMELVAISGNFCTDKKPAAINWIEGRGRSVVVDTVIKGEIVEKILKTSVQKIVDVNINKNLVGSAMAGSIGGFNAHASNIVTAVYLACGQDPAQNVESSNCITLLEGVNDGKDLYVSVTMPSIEVGTVGGGTGLGAQSACLNLIGCKGSSSENEPGSNADQLASVVAATVLAGELSLLSAIASNDLVSAHMQLNRAKSSPKSRL